MSSRLASRARGFSLVEHLVVLVLVGILIGVAVDRLLPLIGQAQRVAFLQVQGQLQSALVLAAADRITRGESARLAELASANPMSILLRTPENYVGSFRQPEEEDLPDASWYFDEQARELVYRVGPYARRFEPLDGPKNRVELKVSFVYDDVDGDAAFDAARDHFAGLRLEPVHAYRWPD